MKDWQKKAAAAVGSGIGTTLIGSYLIERRLKSYEPIDLSLGGLTVDIQNYSFNEEGYIGETLESLRKQPLYRRSDDVLLTVVDSKSTDRTVEIARRYADRVWTASRGKLSARDLGTRRSDADIIVSTDSDTLYKKGWLSNLLAPFSDPEVVAVHGPKLSRDWFWKPWRAWWSGVFHRHSGIFSATNSAFRRSAYIKAGGFDLSVDQFERGGELNQEEERNFLKRLERVGKVEYVPVAPLTSERQMPFTTEDGRAEKFRREREAGVRF